MWRLPEEENLEIAYLSHLFDKMSESYKIFWFQAIVNGVARGQAVFTYEELLDEMVADAWYMVLEYRLNLGPSDNLEALVCYVREISGMKSSEKREEFERCRREHINSDEVWMKLYRAGLTKEMFCQNLEEILLPVYQSAHNMGFGEWEYRD